MRTGPFHVAAAAGVAALAVSVGAFITCRSRASAGTSAIPVIDHSNNSSSDLNTRIDDLRRELRAVQGQVGQVAAGAIKNSSLGPAAVPATPPVGKSAEQLLAELVDKVSREARDTAWSDKTEGQIATAFAGDAVLGTHLVFAHCATSVCQIIVTHENEAAQRDLARAIFMKEPFVSAEGVRYTYDHGEPAKTTMYLSRAEIRN